MKKKILVALALCFAACSVALAQSGTFKIQGHERPDVAQRFSQEQTSSVRLPKALRAAKSGAASAKTFTFQDVDMWVGEGSKVAMLVVDWHDDKLDHALVWGYRFDGDEIHGDSMVVAIAKADPRFTFLTHKTSLGYTIAGLGFNKHLPYQTELVYTPESGGEAETHKPVDGKVVTNAYNYDDWTCSDAAGLWKSGWYDGYWSYQTKDKYSDNEFTYSQVGASSRVLTDSCVDGWSFASLDEDAGMEGSLPREPYEAVLDVRQWEEPNGDNAYWGQMYKNAQHQSIVDLPLAAVDSSELSVRWEYNFGGYNGQPIIVGDYMYNTSGNKIYKIAVKDGSLWAEQTMVDKIGFFSMMAYGDGKIFVTLGKGVTQAFDAKTLKPLWQSKVTKGSQQLCPIVYHNGYLYTGTWSGGKPATGVFYCISTTDEDPDKEDEIKNPVWESANTGFYWSGGTIEGNHIFVGGDDGWMRSYHLLTGEVKDEWQIAPDVTGSTIRSGTSYDEKTQRLFFTGKEAKKIYSVKIKADGTFDEASKLSTDIAGQATTTPTVYNGRVYATSGTMTSGGGFDVFDAETLEKIYTVDMGGISQSTPVLNKAFATAENHQEVYIYVCLNDKNGTLVCIKDFEGNTTPTIQYKWNAPKIQYCTHSVVVDQYGTLYYKNDSKGFWALNSKRYAVESLSLNETSAELQVNETLALTATIAPFNASDRKINWHSSDETVATVSSAGLVNAIAPGDVVITAASADGKKTAVCSVKVLPIAVTGVSLDITDTTLYIGSTLTLTASVLPADATNKNVMWFSMNPTVASVSETGVVTTLAVGDAKIIARTEDGGHLATCDVKVLPIAVTGVTLTVTNDTLKKDETLTLTAMVLPYNATNKACTWTSTNAAVASVNENGVVTGVAAGSVQIVVTTVEGGFQDSCRVTVTEDEVPPVEVAVTGVSLNITDTTLNIGQTLALSASVLPENATNKAYTWASTNAAVVSVSEAGVVTALAAGEAQIIVTTVDGNFKDTCSMVVKAKIDTVGIEVPRPVLVTALYPNPTLDVVNVELTMPATIELINLTGRVLSRREVGAGSQIVRLETPGIYFLRITVGNIVEINRVIRR